MKTRLIITAFFASMVMFVSCNKDDENSSQDVISPEEASINAKVDMATNDISRVVEDALFVEDGISGKTSNPQEFLFPTCVSITRNPEPGTVITPGTTITKTIVFDQSGCTMPNGNVLKGTIVISFVYQPDATSHTINYHFESFYHNDLKIQGDKSFTRELKSTASNTEIHPVVTMNMDLLVTLPNNTGVVKRVGTRISEIVEGYGNWDPMDNVYKITGDWTTTMPSGVQHASTITSPLILKANCHYIVKGIITITRNGRVATLDFGDGSCDNMAILTRNGVQINIILRGH